MDKLTLPDVAVPPVLLTATWQPTGPRVVCQFAPGIAAGPPGQPNGWAVRVGVIWINPVNIQIVSGGVRLINPLYSEPLSDRVRYVGWPTDYVTADGAPLAPFETQVPFPPPP